MPADPNDENPQAMPTGAGAPLWLELPAHRPGNPTRLLVFLHGAGSTPEMFAPVALAWQLKFPSAAAVLLEGLHPGVTGRGRDWFNPVLKGQEAAQAAAQAADEVARRINSAQHSLGVKPEKTVVVGFSQGASVALELARLTDPAGAIVVSYAGRLLRPVSPGERIAPMIHLINGELDTQAFAQDTQRAYRSLRDADVNVSLDIVADGIHSIGQDMVNIGTTRAMQTVFNRRKPISLGQYHAALTISLDSNDSCATDEPAPRGH